jgi:hypothetical protein
VARKPILCDNHVVRSLLLVLALAACSGTPKRADPWEVVRAEGATLYVYPEVIERYAPDDRGGYVIHPPAGAGAEAREALIEALAPADPDDIVDDGVVMRLGAAERDAMAARPDVGAVVILQPDLRRGMLWDRDAATAEVRIDLFADADDAEREAVASWLEKRGAIIEWRGPAALRARVPQDAIRDVARLGPVRWVE